ncbi:MAG: cystathionine beta-synthase, partial [Candidatus Dormibacteraceae bacterium]
MEVAESVLNLIGKTPLLRLARIGREVPPQILAKLEYLNPGGSVKDRPAVTMVEAAEEQGKLRRGGTIVEPTSGNTGVGLAIVAARKKYRCIFVVPDKVSSEKISLLRAYGAEVVVCPTALPPEHPESYYSVSDRLAREIDGALKLDQYSNPANPLAHELITGPEIWQQTSGRITHFVAGIGPACTIVGVARYLKAQNPEIKVIGADPLGSVYSGGSGRPYLVEGVGEDFFPANFDRSVIDEVIPISDQESFLTARRLTQEEGVFTGGSSGLAVAAALQLGERLRPTDVVVVLLPDSGRGYLSKLYDDTWLADYGFIGARGLSATDVLNTKQSSYQALPQIVHVHPEETVREVAATMREYAVSQVVVVSAEPPLVMGEVIGSASEEALLREAFADAQILDQPIGDHMGAVP